MASVDESPAPGAYSSAPASGGVCGKRPRSVRKRPKLQVGIGAGFDPPEQLEDERLPVEHRGVALLGAEHGGLGRLVRPEQAAHRGRGVALELPAARSAQPAAAAHGLQQIAAELLVGQPVDHRHRHVAAVAAQDDRAWRVGQGALGAVAGVDGDRHAVGRRLALGEVAPHEEDARRPRRPGAGEGQRVGDPHLAQGAGLVGIPAPGRQERREGALERGSPAGEHGVDVQLAGRRVRAVVGHGRLALRANLLDGEPVHRVRPEGEQVGQVADVGEARLAEHLDRRRAAEAGEVELDVLRMTREVRHDQDGALLVAAQVCQHAPVLGVQELQLAAAEHRVALAQRQHAAHPPQQ